MKKKSLLLRSICLVLAAVLIMPLSVSANSSKTELIPSDLVVTPMWSYTNSASADLQVNSSLLATVSSSLLGYYGTTTKIEGTVYLQASIGYRWDTVATFTATKNSYYMSFYEYYSIPSFFSRSNFRVQAKYKVYCNSDYETIFVYSDTV